MRERFQCGLVVGKFSPLHLGHELVIHTACDQCAEVIVISYSKPEFACCPADVRKRWLENRFPDVTCLVLDATKLDAICCDKGITKPLMIPANDAPDHEHRIFIAWVCQNILKKMVDAVFTSEDYGDGFAVVLSDYFTNYAGTACSVTHVSVDRNRKTVPVSETMIRADWDNYQAYLSPGVSMQRVKRICFLGGESTGKSTLADSLSKTFNTTMVAEYGRDRWCEKNGQLAYHDMLEIAQEQVLRENAALITANRWLFCDTSPLTTLFYSQHLFGRADPQLIQLAQRTYDYIFLCEPDFEFVQDGTRMNTDFRLKQHHWYRNELDKRNIPFTSLAGSLTSRMDAVANVIHSNQF